MLVQFRYNSKPLKKRQLRQKKIVSFKYSKVPYDQRKLSSFMSDIRNKQLNGSTSDYSSSIKHLLGRESLSSTPSNDSESLEEQDFETKNLHWKEKNIQLTAYLNSYKTLYRALEQRKRVLKGLA